MNAQLDTDAPGIEATDPAPRRKRPNWGKVEQLETVVAEHEQTIAAQRDELAHAFKDWAADADRLYKLNQALTSRCATYRKWQIVLFIVLPVIGAVVGRGFV